MIPLNTKTISHYVWCGHQALPSVATGNRPSHRTTFPLRESKVRERRSYWERVDDDRSVLITGRGVHAPQRRLGQGLYRL